MKSMTSIIVRSLFAILIGGSPLATAFAQYDPGITVNIPFAFSADGQEIAPGTYQLQLISGNFLMSVRNVNTFEEQFLPVRPEQARRASSEGRLIFQVCDGHSYLTEIHIPGANLFSETIAGHKQKEVEAGPCTNDQSTTVALQ